jgi:two-component system chemotaxis response regulator CheY
MADRAHTILVVDDSIFIAHQITGFLKDEGYTVVGHAQDGHQAISMYQELRPDVVTMDMVMPNLGGIDTVIELKKIDPDARIVIASALGHDTLVKQAIQAGARQYVIKPINKAKLLEAVRLAAK